MTQNADSSSSAPFTSISASQPQPGRKITRQQLAAHLGLSVRLIDEMTHTGVLGYFKIGKAVRFDLAEAEAALRARFYVPARGAGQGPDAVSQDTTKYHAEGSPATAATLITNPAA